MTDINTYKYKYKYLYPNMNAYIAVLALHNKVELQ